MYRESGLTTYVFQKDYLCPDGSGQVSGGFLREVLQSIMGRASSGTGRRGGRGGGEELVCG